LLSPKVENRVIDAALALSGQTVSAMATAIILAIPKTRFCMKATSVLMPSTAVSANLDATPLGRNSSAKVKMPRSRPILLPGFSWNSLRS
jgi:hypothetical protein